MEFRLRPGLARAWRAPGRLQVGLQPDRALVLDGLTAGDERLLVALEEGLPDRRHLHAQAACWDVPADRADHLVALLAAAGVLLPAAGPVVPPDDDARLAAVADALALTRPVADGWAVLARRGRAVVLVQGGDRLGLRVARTLAAAGVGTVQVRDEGVVRPADTGPGLYPVEAVGERRDHAAGALLPASRSGADATRPPAVVVLVASGAVRPDAYDPWLAADVPHLPVLAREGAVVVGPLVRPGAGCCLRCQDLFRADRDPEWPQVAAQLADAPPGPLDPVTADHAAVLAAGVVLAAVDGRTHEHDAAAPGLALEVRSGVGVPATRTWPAHPRCGCAGLPAEGPPTPSAGPAGSIRAAGAMMEG